MSTQQDPLTALDHHIDRYAKTYRTRDGLAGLRGDILVSREDTVVTMRSYDEQPHQRRPYGSITKTMTAVAILQLEQSKLLKRSDSVRTHIPELPESFADVTLEQLLSHRSGLGDYLRDEGMVELLPIGQTRAQMIERIALRPPTFVPGTDFAYSNSGYYLLGIVVERSSKLSLADYFQSKIFDPANMAQSSLSDENAATGYVMVEGTLVKAPRCHPSISFSAGGAHGTSKDLEAFGRSLLKGILLPRTIVEQMMTPRGKLGTVDYGFGLIVVPLSDGRRALGHDGSTPGHRATWKISEDGTWSSVVLSNLSSVNTDQIGLDILEMAVTGRPIDAPTGKKALPFDPVLSKAMNGNYALDPAYLPELEKALPADVLNSVRRLSWSGDSKYVVKPIGQGPFEVALVAEDEFYSHAADISITVQRRGTTIVGITAYQQGLVLKYLRKT